MKQQIWAKTGMLLFLLAFAIAVLRLRGQSEVIPPHKNLSSLPSELTGWEGRDVPIPDEVREVLGQGDFLERTYYSDSKENPVDLFVAYFPSQRTGATIHSPKNCLPGSGWVPLEVSRTNLPLPDGRSYPVNRYVVARGNDKQLVLYWYQAHNRLVASEYMAKFYLISDAIRMNRSDGSLIRLVTPMAHGESIAAAQEREMRFVQQLLPQLGTFIPS